MPEIVVNAIENPVPMERWGKDHWSTLAYIECRMVDDDGWLSEPHMRADGSTYPTRLKPTAEAIRDAEAAQVVRIAGGHATDEEVEIPTSELLPDHNDWDCVADMYALGLVYPVGDVPDKLMNGRVLHRLCFQRRARFELSDEGLRVSAALREHKARGGNFHTFAC